jgi:DNA-binding FadR family transcriptional regulator
LPATIARRLTAQIARSGRAGARLGSEWELCEQFKVSRLTLRQAIRLLQDSGVVECRRGRGNGLVIRNPRASGSIRQALAYFIGERLDPLSAGTSLFQLNACVPALAVSRATPEQRALLELALAPLEASDCFDRYDLLALVHCVSRLADSAVIDLFSRCLAAFEARFHPSLAERLPASAQASYFRLIRKFLDTMPAGSSAGLSQAKRESRALMLEMSRSRPL